MLHVERLNADNRLTVTVDPLERRGFEYHDGLGFALFCQSSHEELGRGGRYLTPKGEEAIGFALNMNALLRACPQMPQSPAILVAEDTSAERISQLHQQGYITLRHISDMPIADEADIRGCAYQTAEGDIVP